MKRELRDRWTAALRSGEYAQGAGRLKAVDDKGVAVFCCLGVLCEIEQVSSAPAVPHPSIYWFFFPNGRRETGVPDDQWMKNRGITNWGGLPSKNDNEGLTFP